MPSLRQKVAGFIRQLSTPIESPKTLDEKDVSPESRCFIQRYLSGEEEGRNEVPVTWGRTPAELAPARAIGKVIPDITAATTGPDGGITALLNRKRHLSISDPDVSFIDNTEDDSGHKDANSNTGGSSCCSPGCHATNSGDGLVKEWGPGIAHGAGRSITLYERHPSTGVPAGEPIADCFAVICRPNSGILAVADGVNWGTAAAIAARAAVRGATDYLNQAITSWANGSPTTQDVFVALLRSLSAAHELILLEEGMLTTLTAVVVLPLSSDPSRFVACACNVGDSLAYVYSPISGHVREITLGSHDVNRMRDMRDALGALGPVDGNNPELGNLTCAITEVMPGDIVFITSDGISDNLDPVVGKFTGMGGVEAHQRHKLGLLRMEDLLTNGVSGSGPPVKTADELVASLTDFVWRLTAAKRRLLEEPELYKNNVSSHLPRHKRKQVTAKLAAIPGKLDHATVAAFTVPYPPSDQPLPSLVHPPQQ